MMGGVNLCLEVLGRIEFQLYKRLEETTEGKCSVRGSSCQGVILGCWRPSPPSSSMTHCVPGKPSATREIPCVTGTNASKSKCLDFQSTGVSEHTPAEPRLWFLEVGLVLICVEGRVCRALCQLPLAQQTGRRARQGLPTSSEVWDDLPLPESPLPCSEKLI